MEEKESSWGCSPFYTETFTSSLQSDIASHLSLLLSGWYKYMPEYTEELRIDESWVYYSDLDSQKLSTPQVSIILLEVADFFFRNQLSYGAADLENTIVKLPKAYTRVMSTHENVADLFWEVPIHPSVFCLSQAFQLLRWKLIQRQSWLYHLLFLKTILMLEREQVPSDFILWREYSSLSWFELARRYLIPNANNKKWIAIDIEWIQNYPRLWKEVEWLYYDTFKAGFQANQAWYMKK